MGTNPDIEGEGIEQDGAHPDANADVDSHDVDADLSGELRVRGGHEPRELLVRHLHDVEPLAAVAFGGTPKRTHDAVDAIARVGEDPANVPGLEALEQMIGDGVGHARVVRMFGSCGGRKG